MVTVLIYCPPVPSPLLSRHPCESRGPVRVWPAIPKVCVLPATAKPCVLPATHAASARSAGPLRPNERRACPTAPLASPLDSCLRRNDGGNRPSSVSHRPPVIHAKAEKGSEGGYPRTHSLDARYAPAVGMPGWGQGATHLPTPLG
jgi:hypothetical protein